MVGSSLTETEDKGRSTLEECIAEMRKVLNEHHEYLAGNETATRVLVIDVVLAALGWDVKDPASVRLEHRANGNKLDYILLSSGQFLAVVEAKSANLGLRDKDRRQASGYATEVGAHYAVLSNGGRWEAWDMMSKKPRKENILVEVNLATGDISEVALILKNLRREALKGGWR